jgi:ABC-type uncharacterized transport system YnjBCD permease subunit
VCTPGRMIDLLAANSGGFMLIPYMTVWNMPDNWKLCVGTFPILLGSSFSFQENSFLLFSFVAL